MRVLVSPGAPRPGCERLDQASLAATELTAPRKPAESASRQVREEQFKHLLLPTDGSPSSEDAIEKAIAFAKDAQAQVTGLYVMPEFQVLTYRVEMVEDTKSHRHGVARKARAESVAAGQGNAQGADPQQDSRAGVSLSDPPFGMVAWGRPVFATERNRQAGTGMVEAPSCMRPQPHEKRTDRTPQDRADHRHAAHARIRPSRSSARR